ncbi:MAG: hypothetical protein KGQ47_16310 [Hyphomicrobiales bacterium]|nr:hypothetical protein [Hyphomicrobiales bacterium]
MAAIARISNPKAAIRGKKIQLNAAAALPGTLGTFKSVNKAWFSANSQNAAANTANRTSPVRRQKRKKNKPATRNPIVIMPPKNASMDFS